MVTRLHQEKWCCFQKPILNRHGAGESDDQFPTGPGWNLLEGPLPVSETTKAPLRWFFAIAADPEVFMKQLRAGVQSGLPAC